ncbi:iron chaperone [Macrococcus animalis]|uniref:iron chaperone n=1 Tax=Macrococcus animalis TaxID=3395467 RepID=UPI0039BDD22F
MHKFDPFFDKLEDVNQLGKVQDLFEWVEKTFPQLEREFKWNTPMYSDHGTFILGVSTAKAHISIAPENKTMERFKDKIEAAGYTQTAGLFKVKWKQEFDYNLLKEMIEYNIEDKKDVETFWRK